MSRSVGPGPESLPPSRLGRRCYALEVDPIYVDVAVQRWERFTGEKAVLGAAA